ncbi:MAG: saccharopine dehydrogenase NADP-binding domain-containing protein [Congregibacter sp.]
MQMPATPKYDLVLYGATGFTGKLTAAYLDGHPDLNGRPWAIAGRDQAKLQAVRDSLKSASVDIIPCKLGDKSSVDQLVKSTRAVITTAGPYSAYNGDKLLGACARHGTHYSDLSGEGFWQREMIDSYHSVAEKSGAKIVLGGGVDSIPSDLGAYMALQGIAALDDPDVSIDVTGKYTQYSGSFSGGTLASGKARNAAIKSGRLTKEALRDPYVLAPGAVGTGREPASLDGMPSRFKTLFDVDNGVMLPFFMGAINAPVVRRSLALEALDQRVTYRECCSPGMWSRISWLYTSRGLGFPMGEPIKFLPKSGEGPPNWLLKQGAFAIEVIAKASNGEKSKVVISGKGDPGYGATSKMLAELGLCLANNLDSAPASTGVITPSTALGDALVHRLNAAQNGKFMRLYQR